METPRIEVINIVATLRFKPMPDPVEILEKVPGAKPVKRFRGALVRLGRIPVLFYKNKVIVTGIRSREELDKIANELMGILRRHGFRNRLVDVEIVNVTGYTRLDKEIDLPSLAKRINGIYDPDYRPYLVARINNTTLIISQQGKIVVWGAKSIEQIKRIIDHTVSVIVHQ